MGRFLTLTFLGALFVTGCTNTQPKAPTTLLDNSTASGMAAAAVHGALATTRYRNSDSLLADKTQIIDSTVACPTIVTPNSGFGTSLCMDDVGAQKVWLQYPSCLENNSGAVLRGIAKFDTVDNVDMACGVFPSASLTRQYVDDRMSDTPWFGERVGPSGSLIWINHQDMTNYLNDTFTPTIGTGYGVRVFFTQDAYQNPVRNEIEINENVYSGVFNYTFATPTPLSISEEAEAVQRTVNGEMVVYDNNHQRKGLATFVNVVFSDTCETPISGYVQTTFEKSWERVYFVSCNEAHWQRPGEPDVLLTFEQKF